MAHPRRHDRVPAGDRQPCQRIGQRPARPARFRQGRAPVGGASRGLQPSPNRRARLRVRRAARAAELGEEIVERAVCPLRFRRGQPMPRRQQVRVGAPQGLPLLAEDVQRETGVEFRVVRPPRLETAVPIVLDEAVIGIARKGQGAEPQGVHRREVQKPQIGLRRLQVRQVEGDQVVAQHEGGPVGEFVERRQRRRRSFPGIDQVLPRIRAYRAEGVDPAVLLPHFQIQRDAARREGHAFPGFRACGHSPRKAAGRRTVMPLDRYRVDAWPRRGRTCV